MKRILAAAFMAAFSLPAFAQTVITSGPTGDTVVSGTKLPVATVATLPACNANTAYLTYAVTDATTPTYGGALTGGGAVVIRAMCNGTAWVSL